MDEDEPILVQDVELCHEVTCSTIPSEYDTLKDSLKELDWQPYQLVQTSQIIKFAAQTSYFCRTFKKRAISSTVLSVLGSEPHMS
jgi:hypothetical protein